MSLVMTADPETSYMEIPTGHIPIMVDEVRDLLALHPGQTVVDATLGGGGHAAMICEAISPSGHLIGLDQDQEALERARARLREFSVRQDFVKSNFRRLADVLGQVGVPLVDAVFLDIGVSSFQLDDPRRGFSFRSEGPLDMRMDKDVQVSAFELVNSMEKEEIAHILWAYGEERFSRRIAEGIVRARAQRPIATTTELSDVILRSLPYRFSRDGIHPATRSFQALRIAVNQETDALEAVLDQAFTHLKAGGRISVIAFHSLEDRIVKEKFRTLAHKGVARLLTKKPLRPTEDEVAHNPRSRSARLRGLERIS